MSKYTETLVEFLEGGGVLPAAFAEIEGFTDLFLGRYCDCEIGVETEDLFTVKLNQRALLIIPQYKKRLAAADESWLLVTKPEKVHTVSSAEKTSEAWTLPINSATANPSQKATAKPYTDTMTDSGATPDEAIRRAEYFQKLDGTAWIILDACLREFENLFMKVY